MLRRPLGCAMLLAVVVPCRADPAGAPTPTETLIRLSVSPAPAPEPALRYLLLPELGEMNPGNPCAAYLKCFMGQQKFFFDKETVQRRKALLAMPLAALPAEELLRYGEEALSQADWAARLDAPDWQMLLKARAEGVAVVLADLQQLASLAEALKVRFRAEVALRRFDAGIRTAKTIFAMARHHGAHPTLAGSLMGFPIADDAIGPLEEMLGQPGCPNLFWALANLPGPLVPQDRGMEGERLLAAWLFRDLDDRAPMSRDQLEKFIAFADLLLGGGRPPGPAEGARAWLDPRTKDEEVLRAARRRLVQHGLPEERLRRFPAEQVLLLDERREYEVRRDAILKLMNLPSWQALASAARIKPVDDSALFGKPLLEGLVGTLWGPARLGQRIALLQHVEALRLYAADHDGTLPAALSEIALPLPVDPFTGRPFRYERQGGTAHLRGGPPPVEEKDPRYHVHYEVTARK
jgi:hypothetical protein